MTDRKQSSGTQPHDLVSLYVVGALDSEDELRFENHLRGGCENCEAELRSFGSVPNQKIIRGKQSAWGWPELAAICIISPGGLQETAREQPGSGHCKTGDRVQLDVP